MPHSDPRWGSEYRLLRSTYRTLTLLRLILAVHATVVNALRWTELAFPMVCSSLMLVWTALMFWFDARRRGNTKVLLAIEFLMALLLVVGSPVLLLSEVRLVPQPITVYWHIISPIAVAVTFGVRWGVGSALLMGLAIFLQSPSFEPQSWSVILGLVILAWGVGNLVTQLRVTIAQRDATLARAAVLAERDRMARIVHDGALQVLSLVEREAPTLGERGQRLARLARNQEVQLRTALQDRTVPMVGDVLPEAHESIDIAPMLEAHSSDRVTVSLMAGQLLMPRGKAIELEAAVQQVLLNVRGHAGPEAQAWVLVEETDDEVVVSIRDNGVGMSSDQVHGVLNSNRMGMRESIIGRLESLGGRAIVTTSVGRGLEWELRVPQEPRSDRR